MASDLGVEPAQLDAYLDQGMSLAELRHAARLAEQSGSELEAMAEAHASGLSWGEIKRLAEQGEDLNAVLDAATEKPRQEQREERRDDQQSASDTRAAERLAGRYGISVEQVMSLLDGSCSGDWNCVQTVLKEQYGSAEQGGQGGQGGPGGHGGGKK